MKLMIVESPNKVKKIEAILGEGWKVVASVGHIRDLPVKEIGIAAPGFELHYAYSEPKPILDKDSGKPTGRFLSGGKERVDRIAELARRADKVYLATDPDREGEAISWHLKDALGLAEKDYERVTFEAITKEQISAAIRSPRRIDDALVHAQEARRAVDRLVGYMVSPVIGNTIGMRGASAGRVQSVAARLVVDREREIRNFKRITHYTAELSFGDGSWTAEWDTTGCTTDDEPYVVDRALAARASACRALAVTASEFDTASEAPPSPFSTSLLLQAASVTLKFDPELTTRLAQRLFEQGAVTYIASDSVNFSDEGCEEIRRYATQQGWAIPAKPRKFKSKAGAQEGHEAIRPTHIELREAGESEQERALYRLIWLRSVASQLTDAEYATSMLRLVDVGGDFEFVAKGRTLKLKGWRALTADDAAAEDDGGGDDGDAGSVPQLAVGGQVKADSGRVVEKQTRAPSRYTKASLVAKLESEGIGRPRTFAPILANILGRAYIKEANRQLQPTELGELLVDALCKAGFGFMSLDYTRGVEELFDDVAAQRASYLQVVSGLHEDLQRDLAALAASGAAKPRFPCPTCGAGLQRFKRRDRNEFLWACGADDCNTFLDDIDGKPVPRKEYPCPTCGKPLRKIKGEKGVFWGCSGYQDGCKTTMEDVKGVPTPAKTYPCPACKSAMRRIKGANGYFWGCSGFKTGCKTTLEDNRGKPAQPTAGASRHKT